MNQVKKIKQTQINTNKDKTRKKTKRQEVEAIFRYFREKLKIFLEQKQTNQYKKF